jgi:hypothetical protein
MTVQIPDTFVDRREIFELVAVRGERSILFHPEDIGINVEGSCTSCCWSGYFTQYIVKDDRLYLESLNIDLSDVEKDVDRLSQIFNKSQGFLPKKGFGNWVTYEDIEYTIDFTGVILIANNFLKNNFSYYGINHAYEYRDVFQLDFIDGQLLEQKNISEAMAEFRNIIKDRGSKFRYNKYEEFLNDLY